MVKAFMSERLGRHALMQETKITVQTVSCSHGGRDMSGYAVAEARRILAETEPEGYHFPSGWRGINATLSPQGAAYAGLAEALAAFVERG